MNGRSSRRAARSPSSRSLSRGWNGGGFVVSAAPRRRADAAGRGPDRAAASQTLLLLTRCAACRAGCDRPFGLLGIGAPAGVDDRVAAEQQVVGVETVAGGGGRVLEDRVSEAGEQPCLRTGLPRRDEVAQRVVEKVLASGYQTTKSPRMPTALLASKVLPPQASAMPTSPWLLVASAG